MDSSRCSPPAANGPSTDLSYEACLLSLQERLRSLSEVLAGYGMADHSAHVQELVDDAAAGKTGLERVMSVLGDGGLNAERAGDRCVRAAGVLDPGLLRLREHCMRDAVELRRWHNRR